MATTSTSPNGASWSVVESINSNIDEPATNKRQEIVQRKEEKKKQEQAGCTFQPTLAARRGRDNAVKPVVGSRFDHLYDDAIKRKTEGQGAPDDSENTFKPSISPKARSLSRDRKASDMINNLHNATGAGRVVVKETPKDVDSFKPTITRRGSSVERGSDADTSVRLYEFRNRQEENLQKRKEEAETKFSMECTFAPKISRSRSASREPGSPTLVVDRLLLYGEEKKTKLESEIKLKAEKDALDDTFQPVIPRRNSKIATSADMEGIDVYSRLTQPVEKDLSALKAEVDVNLTFQPKLTTNHHSVRDNSNHIEGETVHDRLHREGLEKKLEVEAVQRLGLVECDKKCTFTPTIPARAPSIIIADGNLEPQAPVFDRLNSSRQYMQDILSQIKSDLELNECTFQPQVVTTGIKAVRRASEGPVHQRLDRDAAMIKIEKQRREEERLSAEVEGMTFQPHLPESSQGIIRRKSFLSESSLDSGSGSGPPQDIHARLNSTHTIASLGGTNSEEWNGVEVGHSIDKASADAVVERLMAAAGKHKEDLKAWEEQRAINEIGGATFSPKIGSKKTRKGKDEEGDGTWSATLPVDSTLLSPSAVKKTPIRPSSASATSSQRVTTARTATAATAPTSPKGPSSPGPGKEAVETPSAIKSPTPTPGKVPAPKVTPKVTAAKALPPPPTRSPVKAPLKTPVKATPALILPKPTVTPPAKKISGAGPGPVIKVATSPVKPVLNKPGVSSVKPPLSPHPVPVPVSVGSKVPASVPVSRPAPSTRVTKSAPVSGRVSPLVPSTSSSAVSSPRRPSNGISAPVSARGRASLTPSSLFNPTPKQSTTPVKVTPVKTTTKRTSL